MIKKQRGTWPPPCCDEPRSGGVRRDLCAQHATEWLMRRDERRKETQR
jgi:hypothetical protein